jgi:hypothetical protein
MNWKILSPLVIIFGSVAMITAMQNNHYFYELVHGFVDEYPLHIIAGLVIFYCVCIILLYRHRKDPN